MCTPMPPSAGGSLPAMDPYGKVVTAMRRPALILAGAAAVAAIAHAFWAPFPASGGNPVLDLIAYHDPGFHTVIRVWYYVAPAVAVVLAGSLGLSVWRVWLQPRAGGGIMKLSLPLKLLFLQLLHPPGHLIELELALLSRREPGCHYLRHPPGGNPSGVHPTETSANVLFLGGFVLAQGLTETALVRSAGLAPLGYLSSVHLAGRRRHPAHGSRLGFELFSRGH